MHCRGRLSIGTALARVAEVDTVCIEIRDTSVTGVGVWIWEFKSNRILNVYLSDCVITVVVHVPRRDGSVRHRLVDLGGV